VRDAGVAGADRLRDLSTSPYPPEPPRRRLLVDAFMFLAQRQHAGLVTPHLHGGTDSEKVNWEIASADDLWQMLKVFLGPDGLRDKDVLDVGCGWGGKVIFLAETARPRRITGFDLPGIFKPDVPRKVATGRGLRNCEFATGYAEDIPFPSENFDVALMDDVLEHVRDPEEVLRECHRILRPGGILLARFPSIKMAKAHHFDRALTYPGLHYLMPMRRWAQGLNDYLLRHPSIHYEPFSEIVDTQYRRGVTRNLNGLDYDSSKLAVFKSGLKIRKLELIGYDRASFKMPILYFIYDKARSLRPLREVLGRSIVLVAER
jgi:ubiquinone/menaquinone biosynthesis C-methylase UbiE